MFQDGINDRSAICQNVYTFFLENVYPKNILFHAISQMFQNIYENILFVQYLETILEITLIWLPRQRIDQKHQLLHAIMRRE